MDVDARGDGRALMLRFFVLIRQYWQQLGAGLVLSIVLVPIAMIGPFLSQYLIDSVYPARDFRLLDSLILVYLASVIFSGLLRSVQSYYAQLIQTRLTASVRLHLFNHIQHLKQSFFDSRRVGDIHSRFGDVQAATSFMSRLISASSIGVLYLIAVPPVLFLINWRLAAIALAPVPTSILINLLSAGRLRRYGRLATEASADSASFTIESLTHIRVFKSMAQESTLLHRYSSFVQGSAKLQLRATALSGAIGLLIALIDAVGFTAFTYAAWREILRGDFTVGALFAFSSLLGFVRGPAAQLVGLYADSQDFFVRLQRIFEYLDVLPEAAPALVSRHFPHAAFGATAVQLHDIRFGYPDVKPLFENLNLEFPKGSTTSIVGFSGCGKTSLLRLLCRLEAPNSGRVLFEGRDISLLDVRAVRMNLAVVWQDPVLVRGSLRENIVFGSDRVSETWLHSVIEACQLGELVSSLPAGLESPLSEWGANLSGGQRQRIALARAVVRPSSLVLLDEATSQIDVVTEMRLLQETFALLRDRTVVIVTHRMPTAVLADRVCVLDEGRVAALGDHNALHATCSVYQKLWESTSYSVDRVGVNLHLATNVIR